MMIGGASPLRAVMGRLEAAPRVTLSGWHCKTCDVWGRSPVAHARCWNCGRWDVELDRIVPEPGGGAHHVRWDNDNG